MVLKPSPRAPKLPLFLQQLSTDEFAPRPYSSTVRRVVEKVWAQGPSLAARLSVSTADYWSSRQGTATALREIDQAWGGGFYKVPPEAALDKDAADAALGGNQLVFDIQTHYVSDRAVERASAEFVYDMAASVAADRFQGVDKLITDQRELRYALPEFLRCIFLESETAVAVLSSGPGVEATDLKRNVTNPEMWATQELIERLGGTGRLINHCAVNPNVPGEFELMDRWSEWCKPAGWKVYTMYGPLGAGHMNHQEYPRWMLDDDNCGRRFLESVMKTDIRIVCVHKGISVGADVGYDGPSSPRDIGPAAKAFPGIQFMVYHSGYEPRVGEEEEGPYSEAVSHIGTNRLIKSLKDAGIGPGENVHAELGSTWFLMMTHPREAAHIMGKLLSAVGEDNIFWGTDSAYYGPTQATIDVFRTFQIPEEYCQKYGYPRLTDQAKEKILGLNACRLYGLDPDKIRAQTNKDQLSWVKAAIAEYKVKGSPGQRTGFPA